MSGNIGLPQDGTSERAMIGSGAKVVVDIILHVRRRWLVGKRKKKKK